MLQSEISDCGACSLLSLIRFYGGNASLENIRFHSLTTHEGVTALNLIECAKKYGFEAKGLKIKRIKPELLPVIAHVKINQSLSHFLVLYKIEKGVVTLMDPACGMKKMSEDEFMKIFTGNVIALVPKNVVVEHTDFKKLKKMIETAQLQEMPLILKMVGMILCSIVMTILLSLYMNILLIYGQMIHILIIFIGILLVKTVIDYRSESMKSHLNNKLSKRIIPNFFQHILFLPLNYIHLKDSGEIVKKVDEVEEVKGILTDFYVNGSIELLILLFTLLLVFTLSKFSALLFFLFSGIYFAYVFISSKSIPKRIREVLTTDTNYHARIVDFSHGLTSIHHANAKGFIFKKFEESLYDYLQDTKEYEVYQIKQNTVKKFLLSLLEVIHATLLIFLYRKGMLTLETILALSSLLALLLSSIESLSQFIPSFIYYKSIVMHVNEFYDMEEENEKGKPFQNGSIVIEHLDYRYNPIYPVLENVSETIRKGEKVFIQGRSGCGKSTLCKLLNREYDTYKGTIQIGNQDIKQISKTSLREHLGYASQDEVLFKGTIKENILMGRKVSKEKFEAICSLCHLEEIVANRPFQYDTFLYNGGSELSGGERQRIILARMLIQEKEILLLDETLSEVSEDLEREILRNLILQYKEKTILYISHKDEQDLFERTIKM